MHRSIGIRVDGITAYLNGRPAHLRLLVALALTAAAVGLRLAMLPRDAGYPFATLYPAMMLAFLLCGTRATLAAWIISIVLGYRLFVARDPGLPPDVKGHLATVVYCVYIPLMGVVIRATRKWQTAIEQSATKQNAILDSPLIGIAVTRNRHYIWTNTELDRLLGAPAGALIGQPTRRVYPDDVTYSAFGEDTFPVLRQGGTYRGELNLVRLDDQTIWVDIAGSLLDAGTNEIVWVLADITARKQAEADLRTTKSLLGRTSAIAGLGGWQMDLTTNVLTWTDECCRLFGHKPGYQPSIAEAQALCPPEELDRLRAAMQLAITEGSNWDVEMRMRRINGEEFWCRNIGGAEYENGKPVRLVAASQDISEPHALRQALADNHELLRVTLDAIADGVITIDAHGHVTWLNPVAARLSGWPLAAATGRKLDEIFPLLIEDTQTPAPNFAAACLATETCQRSGEQTVVVSRDLTQYAVEGSASPLRDTNANLLGAVIVFRDVSAQRKIRREMTYRATHDALTGLANRAEFESRLGHLMAQPGGHALLFIDLDQFKLINDSCGHTAGDTLLYRIGLLLRQAVRGGDCTARLGGDEFAIILENCDLAQATIVGRKICDQMDRYRFAHDGKRFRVGASIGLVPVDHRWSSLEALQNAADTACYAAKSAGGNRLHVWVESDQALAARTGEMQWVTRLQQAIDEDEFLLFGQCILPLATGRAGLHAPNLHVEVLLRLRGPDGNLVSPRIFLPAAERFCLATQIDRWVLANVFSVLSQAQGQNQIDMLAINLSGQSIGDETFHADLLTMIDGARFDVRKLCLEITETAAITHLTEARAFIEAIRARGVRIALDDFGAGASSFGYLKNLPVDFLKIDGQFVRNLLEDRLDQVAVRCFVDLAQAMGVQSIAECIESPAVMAALEDIGVDLAQGFYLHTPEPLGGLLARRKEDVLF